VFYYYRSLIEEYTLYDPSIEIICYVDGYKGLLKGEHIKVGDNERSLAPVLCKRGGSVIGNSRVKLTNVADCVKRGLVKDGEDPQKVAADQLVADNVDVLHTIGGDDTNTAAADLAAFLARNNYPLTVVGMPKTIDNDVIPIWLSLGAWTAAEQGMIFFKNVVNEHSANPRMLIVHEVMGRDCGWLTAATAKMYRDDLKCQNMVPAMGLIKERLDVHAVYVPEGKFDVEAEGKRLKPIMDKYGNINIFISEGAGKDYIIEEMEAEGKTVPRDAFGHAKLDSVNVGKYYGDKLGALIGAEKVLVQKSGYFARSAAPNSQDLKLIKDCALKAVESAVLGKSGVIGHDEATPDLELRAIEFERIAGGKQFNVEEQWFRSMLTEIGQPFPQQVPHFDKKGKQHPIKKTVGSMIDAKLQTA
jgi:diphosphate-dependent phosphofructokinase